MLNEKLNDDFFDEEDETNVQLAEMYNTSFQSEEFKNIEKAEEKKVDLNEDQKIYMDCLTKLRVGTFHKGKFKAFNRSFRGYYVDCFGFDVLCPLNKKEFYNWAFGYELSEERKQEIRRFEKFNVDEKKSFMIELEKQLVGIELTVLITVNKELKVGAINMENLVKISWTWNEYNLYIFANGMRLIDYTFLNGYEKDKIRQFIIDEKCDKSTKTIYYHKALAAEGITLLPEDEIVIRPKLLPEQLYKYDTYNANSYIDPNNPNFIVDEHGNVTSMRYTQMPFYLKSSQVKLMGTLNCLK